MKSQHADFADAPKPRLLLNWDEEWRPEGIFDLMPDAIAAVSNKGVIAHVNSQLSAMFGYAKEELIGSPIEILLPERVRARHVHHRVDYHAEPQVRAMSKRQNLFGRRKDGSEFPVDIMLSPICSLADKQVIAVIRDVSAAEEAREKLKQLAYTDQLTGLPNRAALYRDLGKRFVSDVSTPGEAVAVALFDLDGFKDINDTMGHSVGDSLLQSITLRWMTTVSEDVPLYRLGGDEFVVVIPASEGLLRIIATVHEMINRLGEPFELCGKPVSIGTSVGIATGPDAGADIEELLASADLALYRAKAMGRGNYAVFMPVMRADAQARRALITDIEQAYAAGELELYFQPQVRFPAIELSGAEALLRWRHPDRGILPPSIFIKALADSPVVAEVGRWIVHAACRQASAWRSAGWPQMTVAVNLFEVQIRDPNLPQEIERALSQFNLPPDLLELEISENFALQDNEAIIQSLARLRRLGVKLALDDLGTGNASLDYLTRTPCFDRQDRSELRALDDRG